MKLDLFRKQTSTFCDIKRFYQAAEGTRDIARLANRAASFTPSVKISANPATFPDIWVPVYVGVQLAPRLTAQWYWVHAWKAPGVDGLILSEWRTPAGALVVPRSVAPRIRETRPATLVPVLP